MRILRIWCFESLKILCSEHLSILRIWWFAVFEDLKVLEILRIRGFWKFCGFNNCRFWGFGVSRIWFAHFEGLRVLGIWGLWTLVIWKGSGDSKDLVIWRFSGSLGFGDLKMLMIYWLWILKMWKFGDMRVLRIWWFDVTKIWWFRRFGVSRIWWFDMWVL